MSAQSYNSSAKPRPRGFFGVIVSWFESWLASPAIKKRIRNKEFHFVNSGRPGVFVGEDGNYKIEYYKSDEPSSRTVVNLADIATSSSKNDNLTKYSFLFIAILLIFLIAIIPHIQEVYDQADEAMRQQISIYDTKFAYAGSVFIFIVLFGFFYIRNLGLKFVNTNRDWEVAVSKILQEPPEVKFEGIKECLLAFRRFIKWRRSSNFIVAILVPVYFIIMATSAGQLESYRVVRLVDFMLIGINTAAFAFVLFSFRIFVGLHTSYRDPTVQLCVMVAELHARFVNRTFIGSSTR